MSLTVSTLGQIWFLCWNPAFGCARLFKCGRLSGAVACPYYLPKRHARERLYRIGTHKSGCGTCGSGGGERIALRAIRKNDDGNAAHSPSGILGKSATWNFSIPYSSYRLLQCLTLATSLFFETPQQVLAPLSLSADDLRPISSGTLTAS